MTLIIRIIVIVACVCAMCLNMYEIGRLNTRIKRIDKVLNEVEQDDED